MLLHGQILNLDRTIEADSVNMSKKIKLAALLGASFYTFQQTTGFINEALNYDVTNYLPKDHILVLSGKYNITTSEGAIIQNLGYIHLRYRDNDTRKLSLEPFTQYQWNTTIGLIQRYLIGCNLRVRIFENAKADIYYGVGAMFENEDWNYKGVTDYALIPANAPPLVIDNFYKTNQYLKASISISNSCDIVTAVFLQNKIDDLINSYRLSNYTTISLRVSKKLTFSLSGDISYDNKPVVPINNTLYTMISTLAIKI
jgi:hypothetical protein